MALWIFSRLFLLSIPTQPTEESILASWSEAGANKGLECHWRGSEEREGTHSLSPLEAYSRGKWGLACVLQKVVRV